MINSLLHKIAEGGFAEEELFGEEVAGIHRRGIVLFKDRKRSDI